MSALRKLDLTGFVLFAGFAIMMELALSWGGTSGGHPWNSALIIGLFCGGASALIVFVLWELRMGDGAMIPPSIVRRREVWSSALFMAFFSASMLIFSYYMPIYFQAVKGVSALSSGVYMLAGIGPQILMAVTSGAFSMSSLHGRKAVIDRAVRVQCLLTKPMKCAKPASSPGL